MPRWFLLVRANLGTVTIIDYAYDDTGRLIRAGQTSLVSNGLLETGASLSVVEYDDEVMELRQDI